MKIFAKLMIAALVIALLLPFTLLKDDSGNTLMSFSDFNLPDFSLPDLPKLPSTKDLAPSVDGMGGKDIFYKWYDADGNVQFTTEPPANGIEYTIKGYDPNTNVIQAVEMPRVESDGEDSNPVKQKPADPVADENPYSPESIKKLFEDTKNIEKILNQRLQQQEAQVNQ